MTRSKWAAAVIAVSAAIGFVVAVGASTACSNPGCSCFEAHLEIDSPTDSLVSATGCGGEDTAFSSCGSPGCSSIVVRPPAAGGTCDVVVSLTDGTSVTIHTDWGSPVKGGCCAGFTNTPSPVTITTASADAGAD